ncbi:MAG: hypothetical protein J6N99_10780, partial [Schwartzia sp.]|nr:hypothetical protein [Schwartzia sp. (in: firmicutes)]
IYPHILDIAQFAREKCDKVSITTNGWYCTSKDQVKKLLIAGINRFSFSYHGVGIHDAFTRCSGAEERLIKALDYVIELQSQYPCYVKVGTLYTGNNLDNVESVLQFTRKLGIDLYIEILDTRIPVFKDSLIANENANHFMAVENDLKRIALWLQNGERILMDKQGLAFIDAWFSGEKIEGSCPLWNTDLYIESNGDVRTGCWSLPPIGNIQEESLEVLVHNTIFANNVEKMKNRECQGCTCGYLMQAKYIP